MARYLYLSLALVASALLAVYWGEGLWASLLICGLGGVVALLYDKLRRHRASVGVILKAIENSDYSYRLSPRDGRLTSEVLNRIKTIVLSAREDMRTSEAFLSDILSQVPTGVVIVEQEGLVRYANEAALRLLSVPLLGHIRRLESVYPELTATLLSMRHGDACLQTIYSDRESRQLSLSLSEVTHRGDRLRIIILSDIEGDLDRHETDAWIRLTRVLTHEIMNSIAPIRSISEVLLSDEDLARVSPSSREAIEAISNTSGHLISFVERYRRFSSVPQPQLATLSLLEEVQRTTRLLASEITARAIRLSVVGDDLEVEADASLIHQVLHNLLRNALDATTPGGEIRISLLLGQHTRPCVEIYNSGEPIGEEVRSCMFIPFFSTKEHGSGIGLSLSRYIMRLHGGNLRYRPSAGGATFVMEF